MVVLRKVWYVLLPTWKRESRISIKNVFFLYLYSAVLFDAEEILEPTFLYIHSIVQVSPKGNRIRKLSSFTTKGKNTNLLR